MSPTAWDSPPIKGTLEAETREVAFLGATVGEAVDVVDAGVPWGLYSIGSNMLTGACLRLWVNWSRLSSLLAAEDLGRETDKWPLQWHAWAWPLEFVL